MHWWGDILFMSIVSMVYAFHSVVPAVLLTEYVAGCIIHAMCCVMRVPGVFL